jgi:hypothetical protein
MESDVEVAEPEKLSAGPSRPVRSARTKGSGSKKVNYNLDNDTSSDDSSEEDDEVDGGEEEEEEEDVDEETGAQEAQEKGDQNIAAGGSDPSVEKGIVTGLNQDHDMNLDNRGVSPTRAGTRRPISGRGRKAADSDDPESSDSEFEPPKKVAGKGRSRPAGKKESSPAPETTTRKPQRSTKSKTKENAGEYSGVKVDPKRKAAATETTPLSPESLADTPTSTTLSVPAGQTQTPFKPGSTSASADASQAPSLKIKKKRRLLTGKGLDDLGDILNGPGMTATASPSKSLQFLPNRSKLPTGRTTILGSDKQPASKEALNAIKMAFTLPKARNLSPTRDDK